MNFTFLSAPSLFLCMSRRPPNYPRAYGRLHDRNDRAKALRVGFGSFLSFIVGTGLKLIAAVGMFLHIAADTYPVARDWFVSLF